MTWKEILKEMYDYIKDKKLVKTHINNRETQTNITQKTKKLGLDRIWWKIIRWFKS